jgi:hypothetical protein
MAVGEKCMVMVVALVQLRAMIDNAVEKKVLTAMFQVPGLEEQAACR